MNFTFILLYSVFIVDFCILPDFYKLKLLMLLIVSLCSLFPYIVYLLLLDDL